MSTLRLPAHLDDALIEEIARAIIEYEATDTDTGEDRPLDDEDAQIIATDIVSRILPVHVIERP